MLDGLTGLELKELRTLLERVQTAHEGFSEVKDCDCTHGTRLGLIWIVVVRLHPLQPRPEVTASRCTVLLASELFFEQFASTSMCLTFQPGRISILEKQRVVVRKLLANDLELSL